ncbi:MAG: hypothetical protein ABJE95_14400 [Byssovorax sp.]
MLARTARLGMAATLLVFAAISACSGTVDTSATDGASASASGSGGAPTSTGTATAGDGQGGGAFCGGKAGIKCGPNQFCAFAPAGTCGNADGGGACTPSPGACTADCPGACGCDGKFYCNACDAHAAGVDVSSASPGTCLPDAGAPAGTYSGQEIFTNLPRFALFKADPARDVCFRFVLEMTGGGPQLAISTPPGWSLGLAEVTNHASDCAIGNSGFINPPIGASVQASGGTGKIDFPSNGPHCTALLHATLEFPQGTAFAPASEPFDADMVVINGACPP